MNPFVGDPGIFGVDPGRVEIVALLIVAGRPKFLGLEGHGQRAAEGDYLGLATAALRVEVYGDCGREGVGGEGV